MKTSAPTALQISVMTGIMRSQWLILSSELGRFAMSAMCLPDRSESLSDDIEMEDFFIMRPPAMTDASGIAHIHIHEVLVEDIPPIYEKVGMVTKYATIIREIQEQIGLGAKAILFHVNSPGGTVSGNVEAAKFIASLDIPTAAFCRGYACSAAYKLASGTNAIFASDTACVGNIGSLLTWADCDKYWEEMGVTFKALFSEGADLKTTFHLEPNAEQLAFLQEDIDQCGESFRNHVAAGRAAAGAELDEEVWRAGWYSGDRAWGLGLINAIGTAKDAAEYLQRAISKQS